MTTLKTPGLRWRNGVPIWRALHSAIRKGYPVKWVNLSILASDPGALLARCERLQREMKEWLEDPRGLLSGRAGLVYFARSGDLIKIGFTGDVRSRMFRLQASSPAPVELLATVPGGREIERFLHQMFRENHMHGEWFKPDETMLAMVERFRVDGNRNIERKRAPRRPRFGARLTSPDLSH